MGGDPDLERSRAYALAAAHGGADVLEIGIPFSDPVADGPTIQAAGLRALTAGAKPLPVARMAGQVSREAGVPVALMTYYNPVVAPGEEAFVEEVASAGVAGLIVPDLPVEEALGLRDLCRAHGLDLILLATPATDAARVERIAGLSSGFLYLVSRYGVTGAKERLSQDLGALVQRARKVARGLPIAVGFGVSTRPQVEEVLALGADAAVVGSALVSLVAQWHSPKELEALVAKLKGP